MTSYDFIDAYLSQSLHMDEREALRHLRRDLHFFGKYLYALHLDSGPQLHELADVAQALKDLQNAAAERMRIGQPPRACPDCAHVHEGKDECKRYLGEQKFCRCTEKVSA